MRLSGDDMNHFISGEVHGFASSLCQQGVGSRMGKVRIMGGAGKMTLSIDID